MKLKHIFGFSLIIFILTSIHLGYQYIVHSSDKNPTKGGTVVEGTSQKITYLPYLSVSKTDKWYQHLLYRGCITINSGNQLIPDICTITTKNNQTYTITLNTGFVWSDGTSITTNDIFFTYYDIIKSNQWGLPFLDSYSKLEVKQNEDGTIIVTFPRESVDNQLFFINPILPAHHLTNQPLSYYQSAFASHPITSACGSLKPQTNDKMSIIFDLTHCSEYSPQLLQVKQFSDNTGLQSYIEQNPKFIDYVIDGPTQGLTQHSIKSTQAIISYFHVNTISDSTRRQLALIFNYVIKNNADLIPDFLPYQGLFSMDGMVDRNTIKQNLGILQPTPTSSGSQTTSSPTAEEIPMLTKNILAYGTNKYKTTYLPGQSEKFTILFKFDEAYDKIAISANGPYKYFPESYKPETKTAEYNLSTAFNNLKVGKNTYTIWGYKGDQAITVLTLTIYYVNKPSTISNTSSTQAPEVSTNLDGSRSIRVVYVNNPSINGFITQLQTVLGWNNMDKNFSFKQVQNISDLEEIVSSKSYEVIIKPIDLGSRNDLSILVHDDPMINNAQYKNQTLKNYLANLNQTKNQQKIIVGIQDIYRKDVPFSMLGNTVEYIGLNSHIDWAPSTGDTNTTVRNEILNHIRPIYSLHINKEKLFNIGHLLKFLLGPNVQ